MDSFSHFLIGVIICIFLLPYMAFSYIIIIALMVVFPDLDVMIEPLYKYWNSYYLLHKAASHSYITGVAVAAIVAVIYSLILNLNFFVAWMVATLGYSIHVTLDWFAMSREPLFYPISKREYRLAADRAINFLLAVFSMLNLLILLIAALLSANYYFYKDFGYYLLIVYSTYIAYRVLARILVQKKLQPEHFTFCLTNSVNFEFDINCKKHRSSYSFFCYSGIKRST